MVWFWFLKKRKLQENFLNKMSAKIKKKWWKISQQNGGIFRITAGKFQNKLRANFKTKLWDFLENKLLKKLLKKIPGKFQRQYWKILRKNCFQVFKKISDESLDFFFCWENQQWKYLEIIFF